MKVKHIIGSITLIIILLLGGCNQQNRKIELAEVDLPPFSNYNDSAYDVVELQFKGNNPDFKFIGKVKDSKYYLCEDNKVRYCTFIPEYTLNSETNAPEKTGNYICSLPWYYANKLRINKNEDDAYKGVIIFERIPFLFYYGENGEAYVNCLEPRFDSYFDDDRSYVEFINFTINYEPVDYVTEEDLLSS